MVLTTTNSSQEKHGLIDKVCGFRAKQLCLQVFHYAYNCVSVHLLFFSIPTDSVRSVMLECVYCGVSVNVL